jgi:membrane protein required for beta-lactamase induction
MVRLILGLVAAFIVIMLVLAAVHVILYYAFFIALLAAVAFGVFALGRRAGRRDRRRA